MIDIVTGPATAFDGAGLDDAVASVSVGVDLRGGPNWMQTIRYADGTATTTDTGVPATEPSPAVSIPESRERVVELGTIEIEVSDVGEHGERHVTNTCPHALEVVRYGDGTGRIDPLPPGGTATLARGDCLRQATLSPKLSDLVDARNRVTMIRRSKRAFPGAAFVHPFNPEQLETIAVVLDRAVAKGIRDLASAGRFDPAILDTDARSCRVCGCTDRDCCLCFERTGEACHWVEPDLCSACAVPVEIEVSV